MEILFAIKSLNAVGGGAERVLAEISNGLAERGHCVSILTYDLPHGNSFYPLHRSINRIDLGIGNTEGSSTIFETLQRIISLRRTVVQANPDVVVGFMHSMFIPLGLALLGTKFPVIASEHIGVEHYRSHPYERLLLQLTPYITKKTTVISEKLRNGFNAPLRNHMVVIPNPVSVPEDNRNGRIKSGSTRKRILSVGRLVPQKDHQTLIEAYAMLADEFREWDLRIFGDGELRPQLETQVKTLGLEERIQLATTTPNVTEEYLYAQLFVNSSLYESFGLATAEAMTYRLPVVGFADCAGTNELIKHNHNGILVQGAHRAKVLADGMRHLMSSSELRQSLGNAGPSSMAAFSTEKICCQWEELLEKESS
mgnify:FL=1